MDLKKLFGFEGKNVFISGSASGMSKAATELLLELGANVYAVDINPIELPVKEAYQADLSDKAQIDEVLAKLPDQIDALFLCHGISQFPGIELKVQLVNFYSQKYITEQLLPKISDKGSITYIASVGGFGWQQVYKEAIELFELPSWDDALEWYDEHKELYAGEKAYTFAKQSLLSYVSKKCTDPAFIGRKIRINAINPGDTITGLTDDFNKSTGRGDAEAGAKAIESIFLASWDGYAASPEDMGYPLVVLGSDICSYVSGQMLYIDYGLTTGWTSGALLANKEVNIQDKSAESSDMQALGDYE